MHTGGKFCRTVSVYVSHVTQALASHLTCFCKIEGLLVVLHHMSYQHSLVAHPFARLEKKIYYNEFILHKTMPITYIQEAVDHLVAQFVRVWVSLIGP